MQIFVMRHGQAKPDNIEDHLRELTEVGHIETKKVGKWINEQNITFDRVFVSPYVRAQQTAQSLIESLTHTLTFETIEFITPLDKTKQVHDFIDGICLESHVENILIISHMPLVSYLVAEMTVNHHSPIFQTAAIAQIQYNKTAMNGQMLQLISPNELS